MTSSQVSTTCSSQRVWLVFAIPLTTVLVLTMARPSISVDWLFDEAWRADMVRSSFGFERYFAHNTPIAPGWVFIHQLVFNVLPPTRQLLRLVAILPAIPAWVLIGSIIRRKLLDRIGAIGAGVVSLSTIALVLVQATDAQLVSYFNNYSIETLFTALVLWSVTHHNHEIASNTILGLATIGPWIVQAPLMLLVVAAPVVWSRSNGAARRTLMFGAIGAAVSLAVTYFFFLRPVANRKISGLATITGYWEGETFEAAGVVGAGKLMIRTMMFAVLPQRLEWTLVGWLLIAIGGLVGVVVMWSCFRFWVIAIPLTQLQILVASTVVGWPISFTRVNHAVGLLVTALVAFGMSMLVWWISTTAPKGSVALATLLTCGAMTLMWPSDVRQAAGGTRVFARGLSDDMDLLAPQLSEGDVVLGYHAMSSWYLHDRLVTEGDVPIVLLDELEFGTLLQQEPERLIGEQRPAAQTVWCVLPWEFVDVTQRCQLSNEWKLVGTQVLPRAEVRQWQRIGDS